MLNSPEPMTFELFKEVIHAMKTGKSDEEIAHTWEFIGMKLNRPERFKEVYREVFEAGIAVFDKIAGNLN